MKTIFCLALFGVFALMSEAQTNAPLTNHIWIGNRGLCFSITDKPMANGSIAGLSDTEVSADARLFWVLDNPTTNHANVHSQGIQRAFSLRLLNGAGQEVPLTKYGKLMNDGPVPFGGAGSIHFIGLQPGAVDVMDFPVLTNLFLFSKSGDYTLEVRYWYVPIGSGRSWKLSEPVRLNVIKGLDENSKAGATNAPSQ